MISNNSREGFISAISGRLINSGLTVELKSHYKDVIHVYIDGFDVGKLSEEPMGNFKKSPTTIYYFLPNILFFDFIDSTPINDFIKVTQKLSMSLDDVFNPHNKNKPQDRKLRDFGFDLCGENVSHSFKLDKKDIYLNENLSITFKVVKQDGVVCIIDNFKTSILNSIVVNFSDLSIKEIRYLNDNINMVILKNNDNYTLTHQYQDYRPTIVFDIEHIPDFEEIISFVVNYTLMLKHNIELPVMTEFNENKEHYNNLLEMVLIS